MGSRMMHYVIGKILCQRHCFAEDFLVGAIAPDVQKNMKVAKDASHFMDRDAAGFGDINLAHFKQFYQAQWSNQFIQGYYCHLIADEVWLTGPINQAARQLPFGSTERQQFIDDHYQDFHSFNAILRDQFSLTPPQFTLKKQYPIAEIDARALPALVADLQADFKDQRQPLKILTTDQIMTYLDKSLAAYEQTLPFS